MGSAGLFPHHVIICVIRKDQEMSLYFLMVFTASGDVGNITSHGNSFFFYVRTLSKKKVQLTPFAI